MATPDRDVGQLLEHEEDRGGGAVACSASTPGVGQPRLGDAQLLGRHRGCAGRRGAPPTRRRRPPVGRSRSEEPVDGVAHVPPQHPGTSGERPIRNPRSVTSHVMWSAVDGLSAARRRPPPRPRRAPGSTTTAAAASANRAWATSWSRSWLGGLHVQPVSSQAECHRGTSPGGAKSVRGRAPGSRRSSPCARPAVAARPVHAEVAREADVEPRSRVPGAGGDGEQPTSSGSEPGGVEGAGHRLLAQGQRLLPRSATMRSAGSPAAQILVERTRDGVPASGRRRRAKIARAARTPS